VGWFGTPSCTVRKLRGNLGDASTRSSRQPEFDRSQVVSRQTDRAVRQGVSSEHYLSHGQGVGPTAVAQLDVVSHGSYGTRLKATGSAGQMESAWTETGQAGLALGPGMSARDSSTTEGGHVQPINLGNLVSPVESTPILERG